MDVLGEYKLSGRSGKRFYRHTRLVGLLPLVVVTLLMAARRGSPPPSLWGALGVTVSLHLLLWGCYDLYHTQGRRTRLGEWLAVRSDSWYPSFSFLIQNLFVVVLFYVLWTTLRQMGYPAKWWDHALVGILLVIIPVRRLIHYLANDLYSARLHMVDDILRCLVIIGLTFLFTTFILWFITPEKPSAYKLPFHIITVWVICVLIVLANLVLLVDRILRPRRQD